MCSVQTLRWSHGLSFDLVFEHSDGRVGADELKTEHINDADSYRALDDQLDRELEAGSNQWSGRFVGVRAVLLAAPRTSFLHTRDGRTSLDQEDPFV